MGERTLVFVKPQNEDIAYAVFDYLGSLLGLELQSFVRSEIIPLRFVPELAIAQHYAELKLFDEEIFRNTIEAYKQGNIFLALYQGKDIISSVRRNIGVTAPEKAEGWTVRGRFRRDSLEEALKQKRYLNNIIHSSSSHNEAIREIEIWKPFINDFGD